MSSETKLMLAQFEKAVQKLTEILKEPKTEIVRESAIKRFEFTFELAWKTLQAFLRKNAIEANTPRDCIKGAFQAGYIEDNPYWFKTIDFRNLTIHTYNEELADQVYNELPKLLRLYQELLKNLSSEK